MHGDGRGATPTLRTLRKVVPAAEHDFHLDLEYGEQRARAIHIRLPAYATQYSAATINAMDFQSSDPAMSAAAAPRLGMSLHVLGQSLASTPGTKKVCDIATSKLISVYRYYQTPAATTPNSVEAEFSGHRSI